MMIKTIFLFSPRFIILLKMKDIGLKCRGRTLRFYHDIHDMNPYSDARNWVFNALLQ